MRAQACTHAVQARDSPVCEHSTGVKRAQRRSQLQRTDVRVHQLCNVFVLVPQDGSLQRGHALHRHRVTAQAILCVFVFARVSVSAAADVLPDWTHTCPVCTEAPTLKQRSQGKMPEHFTYKDQRRSIHCAPRRYSCRHGYVTVSTLCIPPSSPSNVTHSILRVHLPHIPLSLQVPSPCASCMARKC